PGLVLAGCGDDSAAPGGTDGAVRDGAVRDGPVDGDAPARDSAMTVDRDIIDASCDEMDAGVCCSPRRTYPDLDRLGVIADGGANDARSNRTFLLTSNKTVPPFLSGMANRDAVINAIVAQLGQQLAGFDVELTRTRPGSGDYMMVIFGGDSATILGQPG